MGGPAHTHLPVKQLDLSSFHQDGDALPALQGGDAAPLIPHQDPEGPRVTTAVVLGKGVGVRRETRSFHPSPDRQTSGQSSQAFGGVLQEAAMTTCMCVCACVLMARRHSQVCHPQPSPTSQVPTVRQGEGLRGRGEEEGRQSGSVDTSACCSPPPRSLLGQPQPGTRAIRHVTLGRSKLQWSPLGGWPGL